MRTIRILFSISVILLAGVVGLLASSPQPADDPPVTAVTPAAETAVASAPAPRIEETTPAPLTDESCDADAAVADDAPFTEDQLDLGADGPLQTGKKVCRAWICLYQDYKCFNTGGHCPNCQYGDCIVTPCNDFSPDCQ